MTVGEVNRAIESRNRLKKLETQEKASYDYILAGLIGKHISLILTGKGTSPKLEEVYPGIFDDRLEEQEEAAEQQRMNLSALRFRQFAQSYNSNYKQGGAKEDK